MMHHIICAASVRSRQRVSQHPVGFEEEQFYLLQLLFVVEEATSCDYISFAQFKGYQIFPYPLFQVPSTIHVWLWSVLRCSMAKVLRYISSAYVIYAYP
jgi:hypothetical protein